MASQAESLQSSESSKRDTIMNWKIGIPAAGRRFLVKNIEGFDPHRIFEARTVETSRGKALEIPSEGRLLRARDMTNMFHATVAA
jgi:hypothetical protein